MRFDGKAMKVLAVVYIVVTDGWMKAKCIKLPCDGIEGRES